MYAHGHGAVFPASRTSAAVCSAAVRCASISTWVYRSLMSLPAWPTSRMRTSWSTPASRISELPVCRPPSCSLMTGTPACAASFLNRLDT